MPLTLTAKAGGYNPSLYFIKKDRFYRMEKLRFDLEDLQHIKDAMKVYKRNAKLSMLRLKDSLVNSNRLPGELEYTKLRYERSVEKYHAIKKALLKIVEMHSNSTE